MVDTPSYEERTEMQYEALITEALGNEVKSFFRHINRMLKKQALFSELDEEQVDSFVDLYAEEALADVEAEFQVMQYTVYVRDALLHDTLAQISEKERNIILMAYWLEMTDQEISGETGIKRRTVNNIRNKTYKKLRKVLEDAGYEASSFFPKSRP